MIKNFGHKKYWIYLVLMALFQTTGMAQPKVSKESSIQITTGRSFSSFTAALPTDAGNDIGFNFTTNASLINLSITSIRNYRISVTRQDSDWDNSLQFFIRRTGNGTSNGQGGNFINGGRNFIELTPFTQTFFEGRFTRFIFLFNMNSETCLF